MNQWTQNIDIRPVLPDASGHVIHTYFNACPESPDGRYVLCFEATDAAAHHGHVCMIERATGQRHVLARDVETEDGHRVAYQQWLSGGRRVVYQALHDGVWQIVCVDVASGESRVLAEGRQLGFGDPNGHVVPMHGLHWSPGEHRDLELLDVETGRIDKALTLAQVRRDLAGPIDELFRDLAEPHSIFFGVLAPGGQRIFFKLACPNDGTFRSPRASHRPGIIVYDLQRGRPLHMDRSWGHPNWHPDGRTIIRANMQLLDTDTGETRAIPGMPKFPGSHPVIDPTGQLFATDTRNDDNASEQAEHVWGIAVAPLAGERYEVLPHRFADTPVQSWRPPHPHPAFSADGRRLYYNANDGARSELCVAECAE